MEGIMHLKFLIICITVLLSLISADLFSWKKSIKENDSEDRVIRGVKNAISHYYLCEVSECRGAQELDAYEKDLDFCPQWVIIDEAVRENDLAMQCKNGCNHWARREIAVLYKIKSILFH